MPQKAIFSLLTIASLGLGAMASWLFVARAPSDTLSASAEPADSGAMPTPQTPSPRVLTPVAATKVSSQTTRGTVAPARPPIRHRVADSSSPSRTTPVATLVPAVAPAAPAGVTPVTFNEVTNPQHGPQLTVAKPQPVGMLLQTKAPADPIRPPTPLPPVDNMPRQSRIRGLSIPQGLPGSDAPPLRLPPYDPVNPQQRLSAIEQLFPNLPPLPPLLTPQPGPDGRPMNLLDLENVALVNSPDIQQQIADINARQGNAIQVGTHPNPVVGYEADTVGSQRTANYQGGYFEQQFKTAGKLSLATAAASFDVRNAELALRKRRIELVTTVQSRYYAVLVAEEAVRATQALAAFTEEIYGIQREQLRGGEAAAYEPMQLRAMANQARGDLLQARNRYFAAWKQLAASLNLPDMPPTQLAGSLNIAVPPVRFDIALSRALERHTDILTAQNSEMQARVNVRVAEVTPIPDFKLYSAVQKDFTGPPFGTVFNIQAGFPLPFSDRNIGGIMQARGNLTRAGYEPARVRNDIVNRAADAFERYENNRGLLEFYRTTILPDQARVYRGVFERHQQQPDRVSFGDVIVAQQQLATVITNYIRILGAQWQAAADLQNILQVEDLSELEQLGTAPPPPPPAEVVPPPQQ